jgi:hypothetical protein
MQPGNFTGGHTGVVRNVVQVRSKHTTIDYRYFYEVASRRI